MDAPTAAEPGLTFRESPQNPAARIRDIADLCVKCGLCLPHCPTYRLVGIEGESPRGRISLIQGLVGEALTASDRVVEHLENCTGCLTCQSVCPAKVPYGELIDLGRAQLRVRGRRRSTSTRILGVLSRSRVVTGILLGLLRIARRLRVDRLALLFGIGPNHWLGRVLAHLHIPARNSAFRPTEIASAQPGDRQVMLFTGCVSRSLDPATLTDTTRVLERIGFRVNVPRAQVCCGALDLHDGDPVTARNNAARNSVAFGTLDQPIITVASGCAATLAEYAQLAPVGGESLSGRLTSVEAFIEEYLSAEEQELGTLDGRAVIFEPCTARNPRLRPSASRKLLERVPGLDVVELGTGLGCCGASGHHFITRAGQADALAAPIVQEIAESTPDYVVVSNVGCALHIGSLLSSWADPPEVLHPISLIARSLARRD
ncbi:MAG: (Fe-S)-binding protein [Gammaproteobacteria bacterium]|nr:MAG: (Fe-S)-binding protein [Gammaproteobacteria bacterium]